MTIEQAREIIRQRCFWLGISENGNRYEYGFYNQRPLTAYAYKLHTEEQREYAAEKLAEFFRSAK